MGWILKYFLRNFPLNFKRLFNFFLFLLSFLIFTGKFLCIYTYSHNDEGWLYGRVYLGQIVYFTNTEPEAETETESGFVCKTKELRNNVQAGV